VDFFPAAVRQVARLRLEKNPGLARPSPTLVAEQRTDIAIELAEIAAPCTRVGGLVAPSANFVRKPVHDLSLHFRQTREQCLEFGTVNLGRGMLVEALAVTGRTDEVIEDVIAMVHVHSLLHDLPVDALQERAALHDRRNWNMAVKRAVPSGTRRHHLCFTA